MHTAKKNNGVAAFLSHTNACEALNPTTQEGVNASKEVFEGLKPMKTPKGLTSHVASPNK